MLTPPESLEASRLQAALTRRFLDPVLPELEATFLALRAETDGVLAADADVRSGKPYPYGYCLEVTMDVLTSLRVRIAGQRSAGAKALKAFLKHGGEGRVVWGVLRDRYFQNAIRLGSLYVDVANDSVDIRKPKVEILPMQDSGLELVSDAAHFARIAGSYWDVRIYANTALPALAPLFPMILVDRAGAVLLQSRTGYMMRLFASDGFHRAERWLREGPPAPAHVVDALRGACPADILSQSPMSGVDAAVRACRTLRESRLIPDEAWLERMGAIYDRVPRIRVVSLARRGVGLADMRRTNARPVTSVSCVAA